jgi:putative ABC transport system permease protein
MVTRFGLKVGDRFPIQSEFPDREFELIGIYREYGNEHGSMGVGVDSFENFLGTSTRGIDAVAIHLKDGVDLAFYVESMRQQHPGLDILSNKTLRSESLAIFRQVFSVTYALKLIGLVVACSGLGTMLFSLLMERRGEISALKLLGLSRGELRQAAMSEGAVLSFVGIFLGVILGLLLGYVLVFVINKQSFGWTLNFQIPWIPVGVVAALVFSSGLMTSFFLGQWVSKLGIEHEE